MEESRQRWDAAAGGWEAEREVVARMSAPVTAALVASLDPRADDAVLELAGGTGELAQALAGRVARILSSDLSPAMVEAAVRRQIPGVEHRVLDLQALELPDASFDKAVCRYGLMLVPEPALALREIHRVLRPGGRLALATWAPAKRNPWATVYGPVLIERRLMEPPRPGEPGQFALADVTAIESLVRANGFSEVAVREVPIEYRPAGWEEYRNLVTNLGAGLRQTLESVDPEARNEIDAVARARFERFRTSSGYLLPGLALVTSAR